MEYSYELINDSSYLIITLDDDIVVNYQMQMISLNDIPNILKASKHKENENIHIYYETTTKLPLTKAASEQKLKKQNFITILKGLIRAYKEVYEYQLASEGLILDIDYVFVNPNTFEPSFVFLPLYENDADYKKFESFITNIVMNDIMEDTGDSFVQKLLSCIRKVDFSFNMLELFLDQNSETLQNSKAEIELDNKHNKKEEENKEEYKKEENVEHIKITNDNLKHDKIIKKLPNETTKDTKEMKLYKSIYIVIIVQVVLIAALSILFFSKIFNSNIMGAAIAIISAILVDFVVCREILANNSISETIYNGHFGEFKTDEALKVEREAIMVAPPTKIIELNCCEDTVVSSSAYIEHIENNSKKLYFNNGKLVVGRAFEKVDYVVNNKRVGKIHAEFFTDGVNYFVKDFNSTNGTYINDCKERIVGNTNCEIKIGDKILLADSEFILKC